MIQAQTLKGFRDFLPEEAIRRQKVITTIKKVFERFGFDPLETPALEYASVLMGKYGEETDKLLYLFEDNGGRKVGLRYDQTVPTARVISQYQDIPKPFKRYQIQPVWRAENTQKGRFREFLQCDADIIGTNSILADAEVIALVSTVIKELGFLQITIAVNDRTIFGDIPMKAITIIDKLNKIGPDGVKTELAEKGFDPLLLDELTKREMPARLKEVLDLLPQFGIDESRISFSPTLARGLDYYTSTIFEVSIEGYTAGSVCGGGRYDNLIGQFIGQEIPAVGFAFGFDRLIEALIEQERLPLLSTNSSALVTIFNEALVNESLAVVQNLRMNGISSEITLDPTAKLEKQLKYADRKGISFVIIQGPEEAEKNVFNLKNMRTREELKGITLEEIISKLKGF